MTKLLISRKQEIDERYIYWWELCRDSVNELYNSSDYVDALSEDLMFEVTKDVNKNFSIKILFKDMEKENNKLRFSLPCNFKFCLHDRYLLVAWAAQKLTNWERQIRK